MQMATLCERFLVVEIEHKPREEITMSMCESFPDKKSEHKPCEKIITSCQPFPDVKSEHKTNGEIISSCQPYLDVKSEHKTNGVRITSCEPLLDVNIEHKPCSEKRITRWFIALFAILDVLFIEKIEHKPCSEKRIIKWCIALLAILDVVLIVAIVIVCVWVPSGDESLPPNNRFCLKREDVYITEDDMHDNIYSLNKNQNEICSYNRTALGHKYITKKYRHDIATGHDFGNTPNSIASIHLTLRDNFTGILMNRLQWNSFKSDMYRLNNSETLMILKSGTYFFSPTVTFKDNSNRTGNKTNPMLLQVHRTSSGNKDVLLENRHTHCGNTDAKCNITSTTQGVFKMKAQDTIVVTVDAPCGLISGVIYNYFDVYLLY